MKRFGLVGIRGCNGKRTDLQEVRSDYNTVLTEVATPSESLGSPTYGCSITIFRTSVCLATTLSHTSMNRR